MAAADAAGKELWLGQPHSGAAGYTIAGGTLGTTPGGLRVIGRGAQITQQTWPYGIFDTDWEDSEECRFEDMVLRHSGTRVFSGSPGRGGQAYLLACGIYACASGVVAEDIDTDGFAVGVQFTNWRESASALTGYIDRPRWDRIRSGENNDFGVLASGMENFYGGETYGAYSSTEAGVSPPPHLVYITDAAPSRYGRGGGWFGKDGTTDNAHAASIKGTTGCEFTIIKADNCPGAVTFQDNDDLLVDKVQATNDINNGTGSSTVNWSADDNTGVRIREVSIQKTAVGRCVAMQGNSVIEKLKITTDREYTAGTFEVTIAGANSRIEHLDYENADTATSQRLLQVAGTGGHFVNIARAKNVHEVASISSGSTGSHVKTNDAEITLAADAFTSQVVTVTEATAKHTHDVPHRSNLTISSTGTYRPDLSRGTTLVRTITTTAAVVIGEPYETSMTDGGNVEFEIYNNSGGALSLTWHADFVFVGGSAPSAPADGKRVSVTFRRVSGSLLEVSRSTLP